MAWRESAVVVSNATSQTEGFRATRWWLQTNDDMTWNPLHDVLYLILLLHQAYINHQLLNDIASQNILDLTLEACANCVIYVLFYKEALVCARFLCPHILLPESLVKVQIRHLLMCWLSCNLVYLSLTRLKRKKCAIPSKVFTNSIRIRYTLFSTSSPFKNFLAEQREPNP